MKSWSTPTAEHVARAVAMLARPEHQRYFFDRLENPQWVKPLRERGFFESPPEPVRQDGGVRFPIWPASRYLARVAGLAADEALEIAIRIETENTSVHEDIADIALALPSEHAAQLAQKLAAWVRSPYQWGLPRKLATLAVRLAEVGELDASVELVTALVRLRAVDDGDRQVEREPVPPYQSWEYDTVMSTLVPDLAQALGRPALDAFANALDEALDLWRGEAAAPMDYSYIWRPAIEDHGQNLAIGAKHVLVSATRDTAEAVVQRNPEELLAVITELESRNWSIFKRLALHLLRLRADDAPEAVAERLTDPDAFDSINLRHEYTLLLSERFPRLSDDQQHAILDLIDDPPAFDSGRLDDDDIEPAQRQWQLERLTPIAEHLPQEWKRRHDELRSEFGQPEHPEFVSYSRGVWVGPTSPKTIEELNSLAAADLIEFLKGWEPTRDPMSDSPEGLGRALTAAIEQGRSDLVAEARLFTEVDPTYVRALLDGARTLVRGGTQVNWRAVLELSGWVVEQPREISGRQSEYADLDPGWVWTRKAIADLLSAGFEAEEAEIPHEHRELAWSILFPLTDDPQPRATDEESEGQDPLGVSINTVRGEAMHAAIRYALWVRRARERTSEETSFSELREVEEVLDRHLDPRQDASPAIRAVYGQWFPWLVLLDAAWAKRAAARIFDESDDRYWHAAWDTYVVFDEPYNDVLPLLESAYTHAIERLCTEETAQRDRDPAQSLAEHLVVYYWRGLIAYGAEEDSLLDLFYECADDELRAHVIEFVGQAVSRTPSLEERVAARLRDLWTLRLEVGRASPEEHRRELAAFGWLFANDGFDPTWRLEQLLAVLRLIGVVQPDYEVVTHLAALVADHPRACAQALELMISGDETSWWVHGAQEQVRTILEATVDNADTETRSAARGAVDVLGRRGFLSYRDLFRPA